MAAWCFDAAITACGIAIENALAERVNKGSEKEPKWEAKYTLHQILDPLFRLPVSVPEPKLQIQAQSQPMVSGVKMFAYVGPEATLPN